MSLHLRVMQRDGWPRPIPPHWGPWLWDCMSDTILHLSVCDNQTPTFPLLTNPHPPQIDATHWCAVRQIYGLSNTPPTHKEWWVETVHEMEVRHKHTRMCSPVPETGSLNQVPNDEHFFYLLCHLSPPISSLPPLSTHILDTLWSNGCF